MFGVHFCEMQTLSKSKTLFSASSDCQFRAFKNYLIFSRSFKQVFIDCIVSHSSPLQLRQIKILLDFCQLVLCHFLSMIGLIQCGFHHLPCQMLLVLLTQKHFLILSINVTQILLDQTDFLVVGVVGPQGVGKSTVLSVLGGAGPFSDSRFVAHVQAAGVKSVALC